MSKKYTYEASCPELAERVDALDAMIDEAIESTYEAMLRACNGLLEWSQAHEYDLRKDQGLTLKNDWHVEYYRSVFEKKPCYFLRWSAMEFIWVKR